MPMEDAAWRAASSGWPTPIPMIQIKILSFSEKLVHPSVKVHNTLAGSPGNLAEGSTEFAPMIEFWAECSIKQ